MVRDDIKARFGLPDERLPVLYNAVDSNVFSPALRVHRERIRAKYKIPEEATVYLLVGSGFRRKGVPAAIAALAQAADARASHDRRRRPRASSAYKRHGARARRARAA